MFRAALVEIVTWYAVREIVQGVTVSGLGDPPAVRAVGLPVRLAYGMPLVYTVRTPKTAPCLIVYPVGGELYPYIFMPLF